MKKAPFALSNLVIILSLCFLTFSVLDWYNPMMNFSGNSVSAKLLLLLCVSSILLAFSAMRSCSPGTDQRTPRRQNR